MPEDEILSPTLTGSTVPNKVAQPPTTKEILLQAPLALGMFTTIDFCVKLALHSLFNFGQKPSLSDSFAYGIAYAFAFIVGNLLRNLNTRTHKSQSCQKR